MGRNTGRQQGSRFEGKRVRGLGAPPAPEGGRVGVMPANSVDIAKKVNAALNKSSKPREVKRLVGSFATLWGRPDAPDWSRYFWLNQGPDKCGFYKRDLTSGLWVVAFSCLANLPEFSSLMEKFKWDQGETSQTEHDGPFNPVRKEAASTLTQMLFDAAGESTVRELEDPIPNSVGLAPNREKYWHEERADYIRPFPTRLESYDMAAMWAIAEQHQMRPAIQGRPLN